MNQPAYAPRRARSSSIALWIVGSFFMLVMLILLGIVATLFWFGIETFNSQAHEAIRAEPAIVQAVGEITDISLDLGATGDAAGDEEFAYRIEGTRASGLLVGEFVTIDAETEELRRGTLTLDDGRIIRIGVSELIRKSDP